MLKESSGHERAFLGIVAVLIGGFLGAIFELIFSALGADQCEIVLVSTLGLGLLLVLPASERNNTLLRDLMKLSFMGFVFGAMLMCASGAWFFLPIIFGITLGFGVGIFINRND